MASAIPTDHRKLYAVYSIKESEKTQIPMMEMITIHPSLKKANQWAKYYCMRQHDSVETFTRAQGMVPEVLEELNCDKYYKSRHHNEILVSLPYDPVFVAGPPPVIDYHSDPEEEFVQEPEQE